MESPPTVLQIAGNYLPIYESFHKQVDPSLSNHIGAFEAANFLKKSGLSQSTLGKIWDLADSNGRGFLDKKSLFIALKLIALVQNGKEPNISDLLLPVSPPKMGETFDWTIKSNDKSKYEDMFTTLLPVDGKLSGSKVKPLMVNSKLPIDVLTKIWDLSDIDQDGFLDREEFVLAMHLIAKALEHVPIPAVLPNELSSLKRKKSLESWSAFDGPIITDQISTPPLGSDTLKNVYSKSGMITWVVSATDKAKYDELFQTLDKDFDGFVTGGDVKDTLVQTGLPQNALAHIWNLCDLKENGKLNSEQFALAMYFVKTKQNGMELPHSLTPEMVPPTLRPKPVMGLDNHAMETNNTQTNGNANIIGLQSTSTGNKELDSLTDELKELQIEKLRLESEVNQDEACMRLKQSEIKNLQNEIETLHQMLKQLDTQKGEARKRLDDLGLQSKELEITMHELKRNLIEEKLKVENMSQQLDEQKIRIESQEAELNSKRKELDELKSEESKLETRLDSYKRDVDTASKNIGDTQLEMSQIKTKLIEMEEYERQLNDGINDYSSALTSNDITKINSLLPRTITPPLTEIQNSNQFDNAIDNDPFVQKSGGFNDGGFAVDPFAGDDPFKSEFADDPFRNQNPSDPFSSGGFSGVSHNEPFDPFGTGSFSSKNQSSDPFGGDPFASKPVTRSESPTPALPPKKSKAPPPRPAPPKQSKAPLRAAPAPPLPIGGDDAFKTDPFGASHAFDPFSAGESNKDPFNNSSSNSFANFANFDQCDIPPPVDPYASFASIHKESQRILNSKSIKYSKPLSDDQQFVWAFEDNGKIEESRQRTLKQQEKSDYELALALSNAEINDNKFKWK